ncbi:MAG: hypothetical protein AAF399_18010 [Bacteroidota bacterium]
MKGELCTRSPKSGPSPFAKSGSSSWQVSVFERSDQVPAEDWNRLLSAQDWLLGLPYLGSVESSCDDQVTPAYVLVYQADQPVYLTYFQLIECGEAQLSWINELVQNHDPSPNWFQRRVIRWLENRNKRKPFQLLLQGNALLTTEQNFCASPQLTQDQLGCIQAEVLHQIQSAFPELDGVLYKDVPSTQTHLHDSLTQAGFYPIQAEPEMRLSLPAEWEEFADYRSALKSKYRQRLKSTYKKSLPLEVRLMNAEEVLNHQREIIALFKQVANEEKFHLALPGPAYFFRILKAEPNQVQCFGYWDKQRLVSFAFLLKNTHQGHIAHFIGMEPRRNQIQKVYLRMLYDQIGQSLQDQANQLSMGRTAMEIKSTIGATPVELTNYFWVRASWFRRFLARFVPQLPSLDWTQRHPFKHPPIPVSLSPTPNAATS